MHYLQVRAGGGAERRHVAFATATMLAAILAACATPESEIPGPLTAAPIPPPASLERPANTGAIFQPGNPYQTLFSTERRPRFVGDTLKVDISESLTASNQISTDTSRANALASKGPGGAKPGGLFNSIVNLDATASGSDSFKGDGTAKNSSSFKGQLAVTVVKVLANGNLVVAGEHALSMNGGVSRLRFSGTVNPQDIKSGNIVSSADTVNAHVEIAGRGDLSEAGSRSWLQRVLAHSLAIW